MFSLKAPARSLTMLGLALMAMVAAFVMVDSPVRTGAAGIATITVAPSASFVAPSSSFTVTINQNSSSTTTGLSADLTFDPSVLQVTDISQAAPAYTGAQFTVGESVPGGAPGFPLGFGKSETTCTGAPVDDDPAPDAPTDGFFNDGCGARGVAEVENCLDAVDSDSDGLVNDGCAAQVSAPEVACADAIDNDGDGAIDDGCATVGVQPEVACIDGVDDDLDGIVNDGCPLSGTAEAAAVCSDSIDNDGDGLINDGCATRSSENGSYCLNGTDDDGDLAINDGCPTVNAENPSTGCGDAVDSDGDAIVNDGCGGSGALESSCFGITDDDGDGRVNDGCAIDGTAESNQCSNSADNDADALVNDGCPATGQGEVGYQCGLGAFPAGDAVDEDVDGRRNDGCFAFDGPEAEDDCGDALDNDNDTVVGDGCATVLGPTPSETACGDALDNDPAGVVDGFVNDGCPFAGLAGETGSQCTNAIDDDADTVVNDGCPVVASESATLGQCAGSTDDDLDGVRNDGCQTVGGSEVLVNCLDAVDSDGGDGGLVNDGCPVQGTPLLGEVGVGACANAIDDDGDNYVNDGCAASSGAENAANCTNTTNDDVDLTLLGVVVIAINDGCPAFNPAETAGPECADAVDGTDNDEAVNDGCVASGAAEVQQCSDAVDADGDGKVNDGCSAFGASELGETCAAGDVIDDDADGFFNDGCPRQGVGESGVACGDGLDNDGDKLVDDGCVESGLQCSDGIDSDGDLVVDDGCFPSNETGVACDNWLDDDVDGRINDGCSPTEASAMARANTVDGVIKAATPYFAPGDGSVTPGQKSAVVVTFTATATDCVGTSLVLSNVSMLDSLGDPLTTLAVVSNRVGVATTADCDTDGDANTADNCPFISNGLQENADQNIIDMPGVLADDRSHVVSDAFGDACDADDDNDGISDVVETGGPPCASATGPSNPLLKDSDGDRFVDGAECALGTNPVLLSSAPTLASCGPNADSDGDKIGDRVEFCRYGSNPNAIDSDGDLDGFPSPALARDGCEIASLNGDRIVNPADQGTLASGISGTVPYGLGLDVNKDGVLNPGDQGTMASLIGGGQCP